MMRWPFLAAAALCCAAPLSAQDAVPSDNSAGVGVRFDRDGVTPVVARGFADVAGTRRATADDPVRVASISKLGVALIVMRLVEAGRVTLDADVSRYLGWRLRHPAYPDRAITLRLLLSHRAGVSGERDYILPLDADLEQWMRAPDTWIAARAPGQWFEYANLNYPIIAAALEGATGERFDRLAQRELAVPLGLDACYNWAGCSAGAQRRAVTLIRDTGDVAKDGPDDVPPRCMTLPAADGSCDLSRYVLARNGGQFAPQGGLRIAMADLARIGQVWTKPGPYLSPRSLRVLRTPVWRWNGRSGARSNGKTSEGDQAAGAFCSFGLGVIIINDPRRARGCRDDLFGDGRMRIGHSGEAYGLRSGLWIDPAARTGVAFFVTRVRDGEVGDRSSYSRAEERMVDAIGAVPVNGACATRCRP